MAHGSAFKSHPWWKKVFFFWTHDGSAHFADWINNWAFDPLAVMPPAFLLFVAVAAGTDPAALEGVFAMLVLLSPIWLPLGLLGSFWHAWMHYIRYGFWFSQEMCVLEVQLPPEVTKSPLAMEVFLAALHNTGGETTFLARMWEGKFRPVWSLEIASNEGRIGFYIHLRKVWRNIVEARLYGQYPEAKIAEVDDYVNKVPFNLDDYDIFGIEYQKDNPQALPIRTYIDYGLDKSPDVPEIQVDPMTHIFELMGQIGQGQHLWVQFVIKGRKKDEWYGFYREGLFTKVDTFKDGAKEAIKGITEGAIKRAQELMTDEAEKKKVGSRGATLLTPGEKDRVEAIERSLTKSLFEVGVRGVYLGKKDGFKGITNGAMVTLFSPFNAPDYNGIKIQSRLNGYFDYPWQDFNGIRNTIEKRNAWFRYKHRAWFYVPYDQVFSIMTTEELATVWHFPSSAVKTPALDRVPNRRSEAPRNLPTGPGLPR